MVKAIRPSRSDYYKVLVSILPEHALVVTSLGNASYLWAAMHHRPENFYFEDAMGLALPLALGLAVAQPHRPVFVVEGDGAVLMHMGALVTVGAVAPANLADRRSQCVRRRNIFCARNSRRPRERGEIEARIGQGLPAGSGMDAILNQQHREVGGGHRTDSDQRTHMHQNRTIALDHENRPVRLRDCEPERQRKRKAHRVLEVEILRPMMNRRPQI